MVSGLRNLIRMRFNCDCVFMFITLEIEVILTMRLEQIFKHTKAISKEADLILALFLMLDEA